MKKLIILIVLCVLFLVGCNNTETEKEKGYTVTNDIATVTNVESVVKVIDSSGKETNKGETIELSNAKLYLTNDNGSCSIKAVANETYDIDDIIINDNKIKYTLLDYHNVLNEETSIYEKTYEYGINKEDLVNGLQVGATITPLKNKKYLKNQTELKALLEGKYISILGDSISTFVGYNNNNEYNSTLGGNAIYYPCDANSNAKKQVVDMNDTYWGIVINDLALNLCVNNSYSGSHVEKFYSDQQSACINRCVNLHNDHTSQNPDYILIYLGINDFGEYVNNRSNRNIGTFTNLNDIIDLKTGEYLESASQSFSTAYAMMLDKISKKYPDAKVYCSNLLSQYWAYSSADLADLETFNEVIKSVTEYYHMNFVNMWEDTCWDVNTGKQYYEDGYIHPNMSGMKLMATAFENAIIRDLDYQK